MQIWWFRSEVISCVFINRTAIRLGRGQWLTSGLTVPVGDPGGVCRVQRGRLTLRVPCPGGWPRWLTPVSGAAGAVAGAAGPGRGGERAAGELGAPRGRRAAPGPATAEGRVGRTGGAATEGDGDGAACQRGGEWGERGWGRDRGGEGGREGVREGERGWVRARGVG